MKGIFFIAGESGTAKPEIVQKAVELLKARGKDVVVFKPVGDEPGAMFSLDTAEQMIVNGRADSLIEQVIEAYKTIEKQHEVVLVESTNLKTRDTVIEFRLNNLMAFNLCLPCILIMHDGPHTANSADLVTKILEKRLVHVMGMLTSDRGLEKMLDQSLAATQKILSPKMFEFSVVDQAKSDRRRIVLPEGDSDRILTAACILNQRQIVDVILLGDPKMIRAKASDLQLDLANIQLINPEKDARFDDYVQTLYDLRKEKGLTLEQARDLMKDGAYFGTMMVYKNDADGMVSGAEHTTAHTIRPALQFIKTKPTASLVSGSFIMCFNGKLYIFADCAVTPNPTPAQLSEIAITTAETARVFGLDPKVAFLSYSTGTSGAGPDVDAVREAVALVREKAPYLLVEGPIQFDAAIDPEVAKTKLPNNPVAGQANVFVFPDLNTGNCCYKAVQRANDNCLAVGPILQGLRKPVNDLSRGCTVSDIINTVAFTAMFAQYDENK